MSDMRDIISEIKDIASRYENIDKVVLFGSRARGDNSPRSDIDLALFGSGNLQRFTDELEDNLHTLLELDITIMRNGLDELFKQQVEEEGIVIYEKP